jgi:hypothetical protein
MRHKGLQNEEVGRTVGGQIFLYLFFVDGRRLLRPSMEDTLVRSTQNPKLRHLFDLLDFLVAFLPSAQRFQTSTGTVHVLLYR